MLKMSFVLERERQKGLCLGKTVASQQVKQRETGAAFCGGRDILKRMEFLDGVYYEDP